MLKKEYMITHTQTNGIMKTTRDTKCIRHTAANDISSFSTNNKLN